MLSDLGNKSVKIGWLDKEKYPPNEERNRKGGEYVAAVAYWLNKGTPRIPARPFFSEAIELNEAVIKQLITSMTRKVLAGEISAEEALGQVGLFIEGEVIKNIRSQKYASLNEDYFNWKKKFHADPQMLIDTSLMWKSVVSRVQQGIE